MGILELLGLRTIVEVPVHMNKVTIYVYTKYKYQWYEFCMTHATPDHGRSKTHNLIRVIDNDLNRMRGCEYGPMRGGYATFIQLTPAPHETRHFMRMLGFNT